MGQEIVKFWPESEPPRADSLWRSWHAAILPKGSPVDAVSRGEFLDLLHDPLLPNHPGVCKIMVITIADL